MKKSISTSILVFIIFILISCRKSTLYNLNFVDNTIFEHTVDHNPSKLTINFKGESYGSFYLQLEQDGPPIYQDKIYFNKGIIDTTITMDWYSKYLKGTIFVTDNDVNEGNLNVLIFL